jgi:hypothetical protein
VPFAGASSTWQPFLRILIPREHRLWWIGRVRTGQEISATEHLIRLNVIAWTPRSCRVTKPKRKRKPVLVTYGSFSGYLFVKAIAGVPHNELDRVSVRLLVIPGELSGGELAMVDDSIIENLQGIGEFFEDGRHLLRRETFKRGVAVIAKSPTFGSIQGLILHTSGRAASIQLKNGLTLSIPITQIAAAP